MGLRDLCSANARKCPYFDERSDGAVPAGSALYPPPVVTDGREQTVGEIGRTQVETRTRAGAGCHVWHHRPPGQSQGLKRDRFWIKGVRAVPYRGGSEAKAGGSAGWTRLLLVPGIRRTNRTADGSTEASQRSPSAAVLYPDAIDVPDAHASDSYDAMASIAERGMRRRCSGPPPNSTRANRLTPYDILSCRRHETPIASLGRLGGSLRARPHATFCTDRFAHLD
jgi:hypothetical protein